MFIVCLGVPLLEENELDDSVLGPIPGLSIDQQVQDNGSFKYRRTSPDLAWSAYDQLADKFDSLDRSIHNLLY